MPFPFRRFLTGLLLAAPLALALPAPASAVVMPLWYGTTVDAINATATFTIQLERALDMVSVDEAGHQADTFQFWVDSEAPDPIGRSYDALFGTAPATTQHVLAVGPALNTLEAIWVMPLSEPGERDNGGWGAIDATLPFIVSATNVLTFTLPWSAIRETDGIFYYAFQTYESGAWGGYTFEGVSGMSYELPEPSALLLVMICLAALAVSSRKRTFGRSVAGPVRARASSRP